MDVLIDNLYCFCLRVLSHLACVASVSVRFRRKERGTRVKDREKSGPSKRAGRGWGRKEGFLPSPPPSPFFTFWLSFHFSRSQNRKSPSSVFLCSETKRKRLLRRLSFVWKHDTFLAVYCILLNDSYLGIYLEKTTTQKTGKKIRRKKR